MTTIGPHCPADLPTRDEPYLVQLWESFKDSKEGGERINGFHQCPQCGLWWPCIEEPDCWEQQDDGRWTAVGWWGAAVCEVCEVLMVEQPDGTPETYCLRKETPG